MQIVAHGVDLVHCPRIARIWDDHGDRFLNRVFTAAERDYCLEYERIALPRLCGRFAAKEAVMKVLGTGWRGGVEWTDIETLPDPLGKPLVNLHRKTAQLADSLGVEQILISISHAEDYAIASALGLGTVR
jgi:holo-[acyl-carrier protein] synthase